MLDAIKDRYYYCAFYFEVIFAICFVDHGASYDWIS